MVMSTKTALQGRYLSLTTYRRDGTAVATPVWFVEEDDRLLVQTDATSEKVKRIRANPQVTIAVCSASGRVRGMPIQALAEIVEAPADIERIETLIKVKYHRYMPL
jgi:PPOX class probable F420-dependent enzyme